MTTTNARLGSANVFEKRRVVVWDLDLIGKEQEGEDAEDGDPELFFVHSGHRAPVVSSIWIRFDSSEVSLSPRLTASCAPQVDVCWNQSEEFTLASTSEDCILQVWAPAEELYANDDDDDEVVEEGDAAGVDAAGVVAEFEDSNAPDAAAQVALDNGEIINLE